MLLRSPLRLLAAFLVCSSLTSAAPAGAGRMLQQLEADGWIQRAEALHYLGEHRVAQASEAVQALRDDEGASPWIRGRALLALSQIEGGVTTGEFGKWVAHDHAPLRAAAAEVLELHGGNSAETWIKILLKDNDDAVRYQAAAAHARRMKEAAWTLIDPLTRTPGPHQARARARALAFVGTEESLQRLANQLAVPGRVRESLRGITDIQDSALIPLLFNLLLELTDDEPTYGAVLTALQNQEWRGVIAGLATFLKSGDEKGVRTGARIMTVLTRSPELGKPLREALADAKEVETIEAGLIALGSSVMQPDQHHKFFTKHLNHADPEIRALAIRCLAHCKSINHYEALHASLGDEKSEVVRAALGALMRQPVLNAPQGRLVHYLQQPFSSPDELVRNLAYELLGHAGSEADFRPAMAALSALLRGTDPELRAAAAKALGAIAPAEQVGEVVEAQGYLAKWMVIGTFLNDEKHTAFHVIHEPEKNIDFEATYLAKYIWVVEGHRRKEDEPIEREVKWAEGMVDKTDGRLVMSAQLPPPGSLAVGYAVADIQMDQEREVTLDIDGDDAFRVWHNGKQIAEQIAPYERRKDCIAQQKDIKLTLKAGAHRFLVKSANIDYQWWIRLRLTDSNGSPLHFTAP